MDLFASSNEFIGFMLVGKQAGLRLRDEIANGFRCMCATVAFHYVCLPPKTNTSIDKPR